MGGHNRGAAVEVDAIGEQQLKRTQSGSSRAVWRRNARSRNERGGMYVLLMLMVKRCTLLRKIKVAIVFQDINPQGSKIQLVPPSRYCTSLGVGNISLLSYIVILRAHDNRIVVVLKLSSYRVHIISGVTQSIVQPFIYPKA